MLPLPIGSSDIALSQSLCPEPAPKPWQIEVRDTRLRVLAMRHEAKTFALLEELLTAQTRLVDSKRWMLGSFLSGKFDIYRRNRRLKPIEAQRAAIEALRNHPARTLISPHASALDTRGGKSPRPVVVIIPIHNAYEEICACLDAVLARTPHPHELLLIDDASTDPRVFPRLQAFAALHPHLFLVRNPNNLGYTRTINLALELAAPADVVLLNSDTLVTPRWLEKLTACAYSQPKVAAVTAISNAAGNFSFPVNKFNNLIPDGFTPDSYAARIEELTSHLRPSIQSGNGFCLYLRRAALDQVGCFDEVNFPRGYGEENDFCMRAYKAGYVNLVDDATFIYHKRNASFGGEKDELLKKGSSRLRKLHPEYKDLRSQWLDNDPMDALRRALLAEPPQIAPPLVSGLLYVLHSGGGGTRFTSQDLIHHLARQETVYVLETGLSHWTLFLARAERLIPIRRQHFSVPWQYHLPLNEERTDVWRELLASLSPRLVHFRHLIGNGPELLHLTKQAGLPVMLSLHDFYSICPTFNLLDETNTYCGGLCTSTPGDCTLQSSWFTGNFPRLKNAAVHLHREKIAAGIEVCDALVTTSQFAADLHTDYFPVLKEKLHLIEHGRDLQWEDFSSAPVAGQKVRILCQGNMIAAKGLVILAQLMRLDRAGRQLFEFHFLGNHEKEAAISEESGGVWHGRYEREKLSGYLAKIRPSYAIVASIWPETYCHTLTESWAAGIPVFTSNLGTLRERVEKQGGGWLLDYTSPENWYRGMVEVLETPGAWAEKKREIQQMPRRSVADMALDYQALYQKIEMARPRS